MADTPQLTLYNTLTRSKAPFVPIDPTNVRMYVCGPTVYDFAHIGNARPVIVFDVLFRLLRHIYGADHVTYVRNITDVDDKINARALRDHPDLPLNDAIRAVTEKTANQFMEDVAALGCLEPTHQPRATEHVGGMVKMAQDLIDKGHAYVATGAEGREVLFDVASMPAYGQLSNRKIEDQQAGARIDVKDHKRNPGDFVLWKESLGDLPGWPAHFHFDGQHIDIHGRPGWHIECSVMSEAHLGTTFDIHGGGLDLIFPHHENEIAQSCCAHGTDVMANVWMHNGFLQLEGKKMSKSDGNFVTIHELYRTMAFGGRVWDGEVIRLAMLKTHYRQPIDFSLSILNEAKENYWSFVDVVYNYSPTKPTEEFIKALYDDLNTKVAVDILLGQLKDVKSGNHELGGPLRAGLGLLGFCSESISRTGLGLAFDEESGEPVFGLEEISRGIFELMPRNIPAHLAVKKIELAQNADGRHVVHPKVIEALLQLIGFASESSLVGEVFGEFERTRIANAGVSRRLAFIAEKNWAEADRIRDELLAQGIQLKDGKDPDTGERITTWEVKR